MAKSITAAQARVAATPVVQRLVSILKKQIGRMNEMLKAAKAEDE